MKNFCGSILISALASLSVNAYAGPSNHTFAWTDLGSTAELLINGSTIVTARNRGWVESSGNNNFGGPAANYIAGVCGSSDGCFGDDLDRRNYFAFGGLGGQITTAELRLSQPGAPNFGFLSQFPSLTYSLWDVFFDPRSDSGVGLFGDLGSGVSFGSVLVDSSTNASIVSISLNAAGIGYLNDIAFQDGVAFIGGSVGRGATVPEPESAALVALGLIGLGLARRRSSRS